MTSRDIDDFDVHPEAAAELEFALDYYLSYSPGSAARFRQAIRKQMNDILDWPDAGPKWPGWNREPQVFSYGVYGYPYRIVYFFREGEAVIVAYAYEKRRPGYWKHRITIL